MEPTIKITVREAVAFERLVIETRDSAKLQDIANLSYLECINLTMSLRKRLGR